MPSRKRSSTSTAISSRRKTPTSNNEEGGGTTTVDNTTSTTNNTNIKSKSATKERRPPETFGLVWSRSRTLNLFKKEITAVAKPRIGKQSMFALASGMEAFMRLVQHRLRLTNRLDPFNKKTGKQPKRIIKPLMLKHLLENDPQLKGCVDMGKFNLSSAPSEPMKTARLERLNRLDLNKKIKDERAKMIVERDNLREGVNEIKEIRKDRRDEIQKEKEREERRNKRESRHHHRRYDSDSGSDSDSSDYDSEDDDRRRGIRHHNHHRRKVGISKKGSRGRTKLEGKRDRRSRRH